MLQINYIRQHADLVKQQLSKKHFADLGLVDQVIALDEQLRKLKK
jgi:seryl-tRNA synthetase